ncbi:MAG: nucleotide-binding protein [Bacteroidia bacterium]
MNLAIEKLNDIISELEKINSDSSLDEKLFDRMAERAKAIAVNKFDTSTFHKENIDKLQNRISNSFNGFRSSHALELVGLVQIIIDDIELNAHKDQQLQTVSKLNATNNSTAAEKYTVGSDSLKVFIVHGHNDAMKEATARTVEKLGLKAIILHEKANAGDTIIEKFTKYSDVGFAVVLLSADDYGYSKADGATKAKLRARQNVIFELGFFYSKLGRKRVVAIFEQSANFEKPSDIDGVIYIPYSSDSKWKFDLVKELLEIGYQVDTNALLK